MKIFKFSSAMLIIAMTMSSCAVMFQGSKKDVSIKSMTPDASIYINGELKGTDAVTVRLPRKSNHTVMIKKENCDSYTTQIEKHTQVGWVIFDALFNWFAFATDAPTGAWNTFDKDIITAELKCTK